MKKVISVLVAFVLVFTCFGVTPTVSADSPKKITLSKTTKTVYIGQKYKLKVKAVTPKKAETSVEWKTSNKKIATVDKNGVVMGKKKGKVTITAVSKKNKKIKAKCKVTVKKFKPKTIDYKGKVFNSDNGDTLRYLSSEDESRQDPHIIKTYDQLKALKKRIKKHYDIKKLYDNNSIWENLKNYEEKCTGDEILKKLDKYNKKFFKKNALYYNCIDYTNGEEFKNIDYSFKCTKVKKNISSSGKMTLYMHIERSGKKTKKSEYTYDYDTAVHLIELKKEDIKGVQDYKLKHYGYFDLEYRVEYDVADNVKP